jgi:hypothetical protein
MSGVRRPSRTSLDWKRSADETGAWLEHLGVNGQEHGHRLPLRRDHRVGRLRRAATLRGRFPLRVAAHEPAGDGRARHSVRAAPRRQLERRARSDAPYHHR